MTLNEVAEAVSRMITAMQEMVEIQKGMDLRIDDLEKEVASLKADYIG